MIAVRARMAGALDGQTWSAPGGESAIGERHSSARGIETEGGSWMAHPTRISANGKATRRRFIAAQNPVCLKINQVSNAGFCFQIALSPDDKWHRLTP
jgi:hypothetical protein